MCVRCGKSWKAKPGCWERPGPRCWLSAILIILTAALCVLSTLMGWVFDRRRDFAIMKALGASGRLLQRLLRSGGCRARSDRARSWDSSSAIGIAAWIGRANFHAAGMPRFSVLPHRAGGQHGWWHLLSAIVPISLLRRVQPAMILRGE